MVSSYCYLHSDWSSVGEEAVLACHLKCDWAVEEKWMKCPHHCGWLMVAVEVEKMVEVEWHLQEEMVELPHLLPTLQGEKTKNEEIQFC